MSKNQLHGLAFEDLVKSSGRFPGSENFIGKNNLRHDIPAECDPDLRLPTAIKVLNDKSNTLCLADALRFFDNMEAGGLRLEVGRFAQAARSKSIHTVYEFVLTPAMKSALFGSVSRDAIRRMKGLISLPHIPLRDVDPVGFEAGKAAASEALKEFRKGRGLVQYNPKIGNIEERRLQCSVSFSALWDLVSTAPSSRVYRDCLEQIRLPYLLVSSPRANAAAPPYKAMQLRIAA